MAIDHEAHKIRIKAVSDRMNHPMEYNDAGAPKLDSNLNKIKIETARRKEAQRILRDASDEKFDRAQAIAEGRMKR